MQLNSFLTAEKSQVEKKILDLQMEGKEVTVDSFIKDLETGKNKENLNFIDFCYEEIKNNEGILAKNTLDSAKGHINKSRDYKSNIKF